MLFLLMGSILDCMGPHILGPYPGLNQVSFGKPVTPWRDSSHWMIHVLCRFGGEWKELLRVHSDSGQRENFFCEQRKLTENDLTVASIYSFRKTKSNTSCFEDASEYMEAFPRQIYLPTFPRKYRIIFKSVLKQWTAFGKSTFVALGSPIKHTCWDGRKGVTLLPVSSRDCVVNH